MRTTTLEPYITERHDRRMSQIESFSEDDVKLVWDVLFPEDYDARR